MSIPLTTVGTIPDNEDHVFMPAADAACSWICETEEALKLRNTSNGLRVVSWETSANLKQIQLSAPQLSSAPSRLNNVQEPERRKWATLARFESNEAFMPLLMDLHYVIATARAGHVYECPLPVDVERPAHFAQVSALPLGAILQVDKPRQGGSSHFYLMSHPLRRLDCLSEIRSEEEILYSSRDFYFFVTYDHVNCQICAWSKTAAYTNLTLSGERSGEDSDRTFCRIASLKSPSEEKSLPTSMFIAHNHTGELLFCLVWLSKLYTYELHFGTKEENGYDTIAGLKPRFEVQKIKSAAGILARRRDHVDILCIEADDTISLRRGRNKFAVCRIASDFAPSAVYDCVGVQATFRDNAGRQIRVHVGSRLFEDALVESCMEQLETILDETVFGCLLSCLYHEQLGADGFWASTARTSWRVLCKVILDHTNVSSVVFSKGKLEDWDWLLFEEDAMKREARSVALLATHTTKATSISPRISPRIVLQTLHQRYEECRLSVLTECHLSKLAALIAYVALAAEDRAYLQKFIQNHGMDVLDNQLHERAQQVLDGEGHLEKERQLLDIYVWLTRCLERHGCVDRVDFISATGPMNLSGGTIKNDTNVMESVTSAFSELARGYESNNLDNTLRTLVSEGFTSNDVAGLQLGPRLVLSDFLLQCRPFPRQTWPWQAYSLLKRDDAAVEIEGSDCFTGWTSVVKLNSEALRAVKPFSADINYDDSHSGNTDHSLEPTQGDGSEISGCEIDDPALQLRFGADRRMEEVRRLLQSSEPVPLRTPEGEEIDLADPSHQEMFMQKLMRTLAAGVGRGALVLHTFVPSGPTEKLRIPNLCLSGRLLNKNGTLINLDRNNLENDELDWPVFHNGVSAGLRVSKDIKTALSRTWIVYNKPVNEQGHSTYAGLLLALGISGHLPLLRVTDWYQHLLPRHELTSLALMLGLGASNRSSMHPIASKLLSLHVCHLNPTGFAQPDWKVALTVQAAAIVGLGLLYQGSSHRLMTESMLAELTRRQLPSEDPKGREGVSLAAGFAVGLICLGQGSNSKNLSDLHIEERLNLYIVGGRYEKHHAGTPVDVQTDLDSEPQLVRDSDMVDVKRTSPGATMALALIYIRTNDSNALRWLPLPETPFEVQMIRPHHVLLRVLARSLIMWDSIDASDEWISAQTPAVLRRRGCPDVFSYLYNSSRYSGGLSVDARAECTSEDDDATSNEFLDADFDIDPLAAGTIDVRAMAVCGACVALGLRFAGSANPAAFRLLLKAIRYFSKGTGANLCLCVDSCALAAALIMAGTGNLDCLRELRKLQAREHSRNYGSQQAICMALGLLFLGGGGLTLDNSNESVAALLCAVYPRFPSQAQDNRHHLQALRHLYALAADPRLLEARETDTGRPAYVPIEVSIRGAPSTLSMVAPCLLPRLDLIESVQIVSPRYWPLRITLQKSHNKRKIIYAKRKAAHLTYSEDPKGVKGVMARTFGGLRTVVSSFSVDPIALGFAEHFCGYNRLADFYEAILQDCLARDNPDLVVSFLELEMMRRQRARTSIENSSTSANLRLTQSYLALHGGKSELLHASFHARARLQSFVDSSRLPLEGTSNLLDALEHSDSMSVADRALQNVRARRKISLVGSTPMFSSVGPPR